MVREELMTDFVKEQLEILKKVSKDVLKDKATAKKFLRDAGIPEGNGSFGKKIKA